MHLKENAQNMQRDILESFAALHNPETGVFVNKLEDMIQIFNHTSKICFDNEKIYLLVGQVLGHAIICDDVLKEDNIVKMGYETGDS